MSTVSTTSITRRSSPQRGFMRCIAPLTARLREERGSASVWMLTVTLVVAMIAGLAIDGGSRMNAMQEADHAAAEAARAGVQALPATTKQTGSVSTSGTSTARSVAAANAYLAAAGVSGSVSVGAGGSLTVTTTISWSPVFLNAFGVGPSDVAGSAEVNLVQSVEGRQN